MILLSKKQIIKLHSELVKEFGGIDGIRDKGLIESSISNVYQSYFGVEKYPTIEELQDYVIVLSKTMLF